MRYRVFTNYRRYFPKFQLIILALTMMFIIMVNASSVKFWKCHLL